MFYNSMRVDTWDGQIDKYLKKRTLMDELDMIIDRAVDGTEFDELELEHRDSIIDEVARFIVYKK